MLQFECVLSVIYTLPKKCQAKASQFGLAEPNRTKPMNTVMWCKHWSSSNWNKWKKCIFLSHIRSLCNVTCCANIVLSAHMFISDTHVDTHHTQSVLHTTGVTENCFHFSSLKLSALTNCEYFNASLVDTKRLCAFERLQWNDSRCLCCVWRRVYPNFLSKDITTAPICLHTYTHPQCVPLNGSPVRIFMPRVVCEQQWNLLLCSCPQLR